MRDDEEIVLAPSTEMLGGVQALSESFFHFAQHGLAGARAVRLAQVVGLINADPENSKGRAALDVIFDETLQAVFNICLAGFNRRIVPGFAVRQGIELVRGMKKDPRSDTLPEGIAEDQIADDDRDLMAELVLDASEESAHWVRCGFAASRVVD